jgi:pimeloyl-ACP methyl ester carboxylesterase
MSEAHSRTVRAGDLQLHIQDWDTPGQPPLVFLHGLASTSHMFDLIAPAFAVDYHVLAVDQRGHGLSDKPGDGYDFETIARDLDNLLDALGVGSEPITLAGHSWGAATALYYAATRPASVSSAILIDGGIRVLADRFPTWAEAEQGMAPPRNVGVDVEGIKRRIRERWLGDAWRPDIEPLALSIYDLSNPNDVRARLAFDNHMKIAYSLWTFRPSDYYSHVRCPVLIVNTVAPGKDIDPQWQRYSDDALSQLQHGQVVWMRDSIHDIPWHRPAELAEVIGRFLGTPIQRPGA